MKRFLILVWYLISLVVFPLGATEILVHNYSELLDALEYSTPGDTILMANGTYDIYWYAQVGVENITIKSQSGIRDSVILNGNNEYSGFWIDANNVTISDLTIKNTQYHCIYTYENIDNLQIINCKFIDSGEHFIKIRRGVDPSPSENGMVENCLFEYSEGIGSQDYIGGIDCHFCQDWIIRNNVFKYIKSPISILAGYPIHFWNDSENPLVEKNLIINCDRGIGFGLGSSANNRGIIRNNMIYHDNSTGDVGISLQTSPNTQVYNNSIFLDNDYYSAIECRFTETQNVYIANNLSNKIIWFRDGATGVVEYNNLNAIPDWFTDASTGDLHLSSDTLSQVIDIGISISGLVEDFDGDMRPLGFGIDIGADEYSLITSIGNNSMINSEYFWLNQNYPNPFNSSTIIKYQIPEMSFATLKVYDVLGNEIATLVNEEKSGGNYEVEFISHSGSIWNLSSGIYFYRLQVYPANDGAGSFVATKKMILLK
jgi:hypothetical protein